MAFASELKHLLECLGVTDAKSGAGQIFRVDANVSLHRDDEPLGVRTEIKNMNSLKDVRNGKQIALCSLSLDSVLRLFISLCNLNRFLIY